MSPTNTEPLHNAILLDVVLLPKEKRQDQCFNTAFLVVVTWHDFCLLMSKIFHHFSDRVFRSKQRCSSPLYPICRANSHSLLSYMLDEEEIFFPLTAFVSVSKYHSDHPYTFELDGKSYEVDYVPGESNTSNVWWAIVTGEDLFGFAVS